jgi:hypothetical protein
VWAAFSKSAPHIFQDRNDARSVYDKIISLYQGRPVSFAEERMHVPHRFLDRYEEQELWMPFAFAANRHYPGTPARAISTFTAYCSLAVIMVRHKVISFRIAHTSGPDHSTDLR